MGWRFLLCVPWEGQALVTNPGDLSAGETNSQGSTSAPQGWNAAFSHLAEWETCMSTAEMSVNFPLQLPIQS